MDKKNFVIGILGIVILVLIYVVYNAYLVEPIYTTYDNMNKDVLKNLYGFSDAVEKTSNNFEETEVELNDFYNTIADIPSILEFRYSESEIVCNARCGYRADKCFLVSGLSFNPQIFKENCLNIPTYTSFISGETDCPLVEGFSSVNPLTNLDFGVYKFKNVAQPGDTYPKICTYYKPFE